MPAWTIYIIFLTDCSKNITLHSSSARLDGIHAAKILLIGIRDSPDHRSVLNKEVKFI